MNHGHDTSACGGHCLLELIRGRAFQIYQARGETAGDALGDWLEAEREVKHHLGFELPCSLKQKPSS